VTVSDVDQLVIVGESELVNFVVPLGDLFGGESEGVVVEPQA